MWFFRPSNFHGKFGCTLFHAWNSHPWKLWGRIIVIMHTCMEMSFSCMEIPFSCMKNSCMKLFAQVCYSTVNKWGLRHSHDAASQQETHGQEEDVAWRKGCGDSKDLLKNDTTQCNLSPSKTEMENICCIIRNSIFIYNWLVEHWSSERGFFFLIIQSRRFFIASQHQLISNVSVIQFREIIINNNFDACNNNSDKLQDRKYCKYMK